MSSVVPCLAALLLVIPACASKDAKPSSGVEQIPLGGPSSVTLAVDSPAISSTVAVAGAAASGTPSGITDAAGGIDRTITVPSVSGRTRKDSIALVSAIRSGMKDTRWPVKGPAPLPGSILPAKRIIAYYGNPLSKRMGILGELPPAEMLARLDKEIAQWERADPSTPVQPALHLIAVVAQGAPGRDGKYRLRMTDSLIETVSQWAAKKNALLFLDIQVGLSTVQEEIPRLATFLKRPNVHLGLDPEFAMMKSGRKPGEKIGTMSAADINFASGYLADLVRQNNLPPKVLVIHRFTRGMVTESPQIRKDPRVQIVIHMDGWGQPWLKYDSYRDYVTAEPVQFTGFKLFYKNDTKKGDPVLTAPELLRLHPKPLYIQYQ